MTTLKPVLALEAMAEIARRTEQLFRRKHGQGQRHKGRARGNNERDDVGCSERHQAHPPYDSVAVRNKYFVAGADPRG